MTAPSGSLYRHGFVRVAVATPAVVVADPASNGAATLDLARQAAARQAALVVFTELGLAGYTSDDLFFQDALLDAVEAEIARLAEASAGLATVLAVGAPLRHEAKLFNCAVVIGQGRVLGVVPKTYLPNYREFYEKRQFAAAADALSATLRVAGAEVPFGTDLIFDWPAPSGFSLHVEICEDVWTPIPPSTYGALAGATVLANLSASNVTIGKADFRHLLCAAQSAKCVAAYLYSGAGFGESTTDLAWDGHALIYENGERLAEGPRYAPQPKLLTADLDVERLRQERTRLTSFTDCARAHRDRLTAFRHVPVAWPLPAPAVRLERIVPRYPYVPADPARRDERCHEVYDIQVQGLAKRLQATGVTRPVIGVSGGLDSAQALIVTVKAMERLGLRRSQVLAYSLPGFATGDRTRDSARRLMEALGVTAGEIDIRPSAMQMLRDIGHPYAGGEPVYDIAFENVQAGERSSHLFRLANRHGGLVVGTGDLSEIALGYSTYGVGDQMSHYNVNASVPKTLIQHLVRWAADSGQVEPAAGAVLRAIADTPISPELVPAGDAAPVQTAEGEIGDYALNDFFLYYVSRFGFRPSKVMFLAEAAWSDPLHGPWPDTVPADRRIAYDRATIRHWLERFLYRFVQFSQFKRSALPNGPKVGSGGSLSPRGDWRAPSDAVAAAWLEELRRAET